MASLQEMLTQEGFENGKFPVSHKLAKFSDRTAPQDSVILPLYICHDRRSFDYSKQKTEKTSVRNVSSSYSSKRDFSVSEKSNSKSFGPGLGIMDEPAIDEVAIRAIVSILSGYVGRYVKDEAFREIIRDKCSFCLVRKKIEPDNGVFANLELGIESIDRLVEENQGPKMELRMKILRNSIRLLSIVASLNSNNSLKNGSTCGTPNSHLSACAQLYLAIVYKIERNDTISSRHLLQVFCDSPFLARTHLLPDLWEHFFLPHLLHLKVWYSQEIEFLSDLGYGDKERKMKSLSRVYNEHMDIGTVQFSLYYKQWLKVGTKSPPLPSVPLPSRSNYGSSRRRSSDSYRSYSSLNKNLYKAVFGPTPEQRSMKFDDRSVKDSFNKKITEEEDDFFADGDNYDTFSSIHRGDRTHRRASTVDFSNPKADVWPVTQKPDYFRFLMCQSVPKESMANINSTPKNSSLRKEEKPNLLSNNVSNAISTISSSDILSECEIAIRVITKAWLDSHGDPAIEDALTKAPIIEGMLEVLYASDEDEILELVTSVLAELVARNGAIRQIILNSDPQLEVFLRLLRSTSLFLKASILLYLLKPKAKQMISNEWVPLLLRILEFGDQLQTLFTVRCSPRVAAFYLLDQLLTGFDEDRNFENGKQLVALGGLSLLLRSIEKGDNHEKKIAAMIIFCCIQADGSCRNYLAENLSKASLLELIVHESQENSNRCGLALLAELLCLSRRTRITKFLDGLKEGWSGLNTMNILLVYLRRAPPEEHPLIAAIILQLDFMGDPTKCSIYREEAVEAIITSLDCQRSSEKVQEQSARALLMLGGRFSYAGEASAENWLLQQAGFKERSLDTVHDNHVVDCLIQSDGEEETKENWQLTAASVLFNTGNKRFLAALSSSMANGIPSLAKSSLISVSWMSGLFHSVRDENFHSMACSILLPQLLRFLNFDKDVEERVLASYSLLNLARCSECISMFPLMDEELFNCLQNLYLVTWTADELISIMISNSKHQYFNLETSHSRGNKR